MAGQTITNWGTAGSQLNGTSGSTTGSDSNDPQWLAWPGDNAGNYVYLPGTTGNFLQVPDAADLDITGDIDLRVYVAMDDWTPASTQVLIGKENEGAQRSYWLLLQTDGKLYFYWSTTGSDFPNAASTVATGITDGAAKWVRVTLDVDNGAAGKTVTFYTSDDGTTWTTLGTPVTTAGTTSIFASTTDLGIGAVVNTATGGFLSAGKFYRAQVYNGIAGTKVLDVDTSVITTGAATSFTALTGQTVTINRGTSGRKTVAVTASCWLFGTDDYLEVADNALLDFGATDSFTALCVIRQWGTPAINSYYVSKRGGAPQIGYSINSGGSSGNYGTTIIDGTNAASTSGTYSAAGAITVLSTVIDRSGNTITSRANTTAVTPVSTSAVGSIASSNVLRIGSFSTGGSYQDFELLAVAVIRRTLSATEIASIVTYYQSRWP